MKTEDKIVTKALEMFNIRGIEYVGLREISAELGIRVGNITYYFPTKDDLVNRLSLDLNKLNSKVFVAAREAGLTWPLPSHSSRCPAGIVTVPRGQHATLRQIEFLPLSENRILAILVINDREVQNRILHLDREYSESELIQAANFINEKYAGMDMLQVREQIVSDMEDLRDSMNQAMQDIISVAHSALAGAAEPGGEFVLTGETKLMDFAELSDIETLRALFDAFSRKRMILDLMDRSIDAQGVRVFIGEESQDAADAQECFEKALRFSDTGSAIQRFAGEALKKYGVPQGS